MVTAARCGIWCPFSARGGAWTSDSLPVVGKALSKFSEPLGVNTSLSPTFPGRAGALGPKVTYYQKMVTWVSVEGQTNAAGRGLKASTAKVENLFCCLRGNFKNDTLGRGGKRMAI